MYCTKCGKLQKENAKFCSACGTALNTAGTYDSLKTQNYDIKRLCRRGLTTIFGVLIFVLLVAVIMCFTVRDSMKPSKTSNILDRVSIADILDELNFDFEFFSLGRIVEDEEKSLVEMTDLNDYLEEVVNEYTEFMLGGPEPEGIQGKKVAKIISENRVFIEKEFGYEFKDWEIELIEENIGETREFKNIHRREEGFVIMRVLLSPYLLALTILLLILCMIGFLFFGADRLKTIRNMGILFVSASIFAIVAFVIAKIGCMIVFYGSIAMVADAYLSGAILSACIIAGITLLTGIVIICVSHRVKVSKTKTINNEVV